MKNAAAELHLGYYKMTVFVGDARTAGPRLAGRIIIATVVAFCVVLIAFLAHKANQPPGLFYELRSITGEPLWCVITPMTSDQGDVVYYDIADDLVVIVMTGVSDPPAVGDSIDGNRATLRVGSADEISITREPRTLVLTRAGQVVKRSPLSPGFAERLRNYFGSFGSTFPDTTSALRSASVSNDEAERLGACLAAARTE